MATCEWPQVPIGDVCEGIYDGPHATPPKTDSGPVFLGIWNLVSGRVDLSETEHVSDEFFKKWTRRVTPRAGDLVFSYETRLGDGAMIPAGLVCCLGRRMALARPDRDKIHPRFLLYSFLAPEFQETIRKHTVHGSTVDRIPLLEFPQFPVRLPPRFEQEAIAETLGALDDKIEQNHRTGRALERLARATFKAWFVDFEPVKAKAAGRTGFPGMPPEAFAALPNTLQDSPHGPVPQGWALRTLAEVFEINPPRRLSKGEDAPYLDMKNMPTDGHAPDAWERRAHGSGMRFINGDTLVARITPCLENGKTAYVDFLNNGEVAWGSTEYIVLRPKPPLPEIYAYCLARTPDFRDFAIQNMTGTSGRQRVSASALEHYHVAVPDAVTSVAFGDLVQPLFDCVRAGKAESSRLSALRDYLLPRLLTGAVRVNSKGAL